MLVISLAESSFHFGDIELANIFLGPSTEQSGKLTQAVACAQMQNYDTVGWHRAKFPSKVLFIVTSLHIVTNHESKRHLSNSLFCVKLNVIDKRSGPRLKISLLR